MALRVDELLPGQFLEALPGLPCREATTGIATIPLFVLLAEEVPLARLHAQIAWQ